MPCPSIGPKQFWTAVQIIKTSQEKSNLSLSKMICTRPKKIVHVQTELYTSIHNDLDGPESFLHYRRTRHTVDSAKLLLILFCLWQLYVIP